MPQFRNPTGQPGEQHVQNNQIASPASFRPIADPADSQVRTDTGDLAGVVTVIGQDSETIAKGGSGDEQVNWMDAGSLT
jgi:hypothetical protein